VVTSFSLLEKKIHATDELSVGSDVSRDFLKELCPESEEDWHKWYNKELDEMIIDLRVCQTELKQGMDDIHVLWRIIQSLTAVIFTIDGAIAKFKSASIDGGDKATAAAMENLLNKRKEIIQENSLVMTLGSKLANK